MRMSTSSQRRRCSKLTWVVRALGVGGGRRRPAGAVGAEEKCVRFSKDDDNGRRPIDVWVGESRREPSGAKKSTPSRVAEDA